MLGLHRDGDYGWCPLAQGDGLGRRCSRYVDGLFGSAGMLRGGGGLRVYLAEAQREPGPISVSLIKRTCQWSGLGAIELLPES